MGMPKEKGSGIPYSIATTIPRKNKELKEKKNFRLSVAIAYISFFFMWLILFILELA